MYFIFTRQYVLKYIGTPMYIKKIKLNQINSYNAIDCVSQEVKCEKKNVLPKKKTNSKLFFEYF